MKIVAYLVFTWSDDDETLIYMSTNKQKAISYAEEYFNNVKYHTWIEEHLINLEDFDLKQYCCYYPDFEGIIWQKT
jgi:hypothetical protein